MSQPGSDKSVQNPVSKRGRPSPLRHLFLTGYPGYIGRRLALQVLVSKRSTKLTVLVQRQFLEQARGELESLSTAQQSRITLLVGDVAKMDLGLSGPEITRLTQNVTHIFHLAALQYLGVPEDELRAVNVDGTRNVLLLAREIKGLKRFVHFSSCYVSGDRIGVITEDELDQGQGFRNAYESTKYRAEILVRAAMDALPITIVRPAIVVGHSKTGEIDRFDKGIYAMGVLVVTSPISVPLPLPGDCIAPLNLVPVDFVIDATLALATAPEAEGKTFHLVDPNPLSSRHVYELIAAKAGKRLSRVNISYGVVKRLLRLPFVGRLSKVRVQAQAIDYLNHLAIYNCTNTLSVLSGTGIMCPPFSSYVDKLMDFISQSRRTERMHQQRPNAKSQSPDPFDVEEAT